MRLATVGQPGDEASDVEGQPGDEASCSRAAWLAAVTSPASVEYTILKDRRGEPSDENPRIRINKVSICTV